MKKLVLVVALFLPSIAQAEMDLESFRALKGQYEGQNYLYLSGILQGVQWSNTALAFGNKTPLFCLPPGFDYSVKTVGQLVQESTNKAAVSPDTPIGMVMVSVLSGGFPCAAGKKM